MTRVLLVDDDDTVTEVVDTYLRADGMEVARCADGAGAVAAAADFAPDLVILDVMLPGVDGIEVLRRLRLRGMATPVIMLTALGEEDDRILGLEVGADDYLTKPFSPRELVLRVKSVLRRSEPTLPEADTGDVLVDGALSLDQRSRRANLDGRELLLTQREFDLLAHFLAHPDRVLTRDALMAAVWGWDHGDPSTVTVHVRRLREKVEPDPACPTRIVTVWGRGYRWQPDARDEP